jgi:O-antigen/teichoic acid export membrane protein
MSNRIDKISSGVNAIFIGMLLTNIIGIVFQPILVRLLGTSDYGQLATILAVFGIISNIAAVGMQDSIRKHITQHKSNSSEITSFSLGFLGLSGLLVAVISFTILNLPIVENFLGSEITYLLILALPALITNNLLQGTRSILFGLYQENYGESLKVIRKLSYPLIAIGLINFGLGVKGVIVSHVISPLIAGIFGIYFLRNEISFSPYNFLKGANRHGSELLSYGSLMVVSLLFVQFHYQSDILLVRYFEGESATGVYKGILVVVQFLWLAPKAIQQTMLHNISDLYSQGEVIKIENITSNLLKYTALTLTLLGTGLFVLAKPFLNTYYGSSFLQGTTAMQILIPGVLLMGLARLLTPVAQGTDFVKESMYASGTATALNLVLNLILIPRYGIEGAATATSISYASLLLFYGVILFVRIDINPFKAFFLLKTFLIGGLTGIILHFISEILMSPLSKLLLIPGLGFVTFLLLSILGNAIDIEETFENLETTKIYDNRKTKKLAENSKHIMLKIDNRLQIW